MNKKSKKISPIQVFRFIVQIIFFVILPGLFINALAGLKQLYLSIVNDSFTFNGDLTYLIEVIAIIPATILLGRFFCGWMCAFGTFADILSSISKNIFRVNIKVNERLDKTLKLLKFAVLGFLIFAVWQFSLIDINSSDPWNVFGVLATFNRVPDFAYAYTELTIGFLILIAIAIVSFFIERFFCRYLCPLGAIFSIISKLKLTKIKKPSDKCGSCRICTKNCVMGIPLYSCNKVSSGECISCFKCVPACPRKNVNLDIAGEDVRTGAAAVIAVAAITGFYYAGSAFTKDSSAQNNTNTSSSISGKSSNNTSNSSSSSSKSPSSKNTSNSSAYKDGTYEGSANGFRGKTTVSVKVENGTIANVTVSSSGDDRQFINRASSSVISQIIEKQTTKVDSVSGATYSSNGIINAVANALKKAQ
jgi:polyferredoxin/uncharacterized protein with FMN-binding domain